MSAAVSAEVSAAPAPSIVDRIHALEAESIALRRASGLPGSRDRAIDYLMEWRTLVRENERLRGLLAEALPDRAGALRAKAKLLRRELDGAYRDLAARNVQLAAQGYVWPDAKYGGWRRHPGPEVTRAVVEQALRSVRWLVTWFVRRESDAGRAPPAEYVAFLRGGSNGAPATLAAVLDLERRVVDAEAVCAGRPGDIW